MKNLFSVKVIKTNESLHGEEGNNSQLQIYMLPTFNLAHQDFPFLYLPSNITNSCSLYLLIFSLLWCFLTFI